jgi:NAD(P)-dependent dehydrogenase (short-subunit alcohol dehydrogenase family)
MAELSRVMVVTGAASGIGRHLVGLLAAAGHRVVAADLDRARLKKEARAAAWPESRVLLRALDVRDAAAWPAVIDVAFQTWRRLDVLLNLAGVLRPSYAHAAPASDVDLHLDVNAKGVIHGTRAAAARMVAQGHGHIVNMASLAALAPVPGLSLYVASKFAVRGFSLSVAHELRPLGVDVSVVCPDAVWTPMLQPLITRPEAALAFSARVLTVQEVGRVITERVLRKRPLETFLPRSRGLIARAANLWPGLGLWLAPLLLRRGQARQRALRAEMELGKEEP